MVFNKQMKGLSYNEGDNYLLPLEDYYNQPIEELKVIFAPFTKEQLLKFSKKADIPVKSYYSEKKIRDHIINQLYMTGIYRRIAQNKSE